MSGIAFRKFCRLANSHYALSPRTNVGRAILDSIGVSLVLAPPMYIAWGIYLISGRIVSRYLLYAFVSVIPLGLLAIERLCVGYMFTDVIIWVAYYCLVLYFGMFINHDIWLKMVHAGDNISNLFVDERDRVVFARSLPSHISPQLLIFFAMGAISASMLYIMRDILEKYQLNLMAVSYIQVFIIGGLASCLAYWLLLLSVTIVRISRVSNLHFYVNAPSHTPAIRQLTSVLAVGALLSAVGMAALMFPPYHYLLQVRTMMEVRVVLLAIVLATGFTVISVAVLPHFGIYLTLTSYKRRLLDGISSQISQIAGGLGHGDLHIQNAFTPDEVLRLQMLLNLYNAILKSSAIPLSGAAVARYALSGATTALPYLLSFAVGKW